MPGPLYPIQPTFVRGEISPRLFSRVDVDHWKMSLAECLNFTVLKQGGLRRRSGSEWINVVKDQSKRTRLVRFVFSTIQAYVCEFGEGYVRFFANGGIVNKGAATGITFSGTSVNWNAHGLVADDPVMFNSSGGLPSPLQIGKTYYVVGTPATNTFSVSATKGGAAITFTGGSGTHSGFAPVEVATPYTLDEVWKLQFAQSADVLYIASTEHPQYMLSRFSASDFRMLIYTGYDGPYLGENTTTTVMTPNAISGNIVITASSTVGVNAGAGFVASDVGRAISLQYSAKWYYCKITSVADNLNVYADVFGYQDDMGNSITSLPGTGSTGGWKLGAWCLTTGWPGCVAFFQQRLVWGRTDTQPQTIWMSKAGVLDNFATTIPMQDDDGITLTILAGEVNAITWIAEGADLMIGTNGAMRTIGPADSSKNFSATNLTQRRQSTFGSMDLQPVQIGEVAIYASYYGLSLREFLFSFQNNSYISPELTILSEHMLRSGVKQFSYAQDRDSIVWMAMGNGELVGMTYDRDQQIVALNRHRLGGECLASGIVDPADPDNPDTPYGIVESVTTIPGPDRTEVWVAVRRTVGGQETRYVERLTRPFEAMQKEDGVFVDSSYQYSGAPTNSLFGAYWLAGQTVTVLADGAVVPDVVVDASGGFALANGKIASKITFGLNYTSRAKTLPIAQGQQDGTGMGRLKNIIRADINAMETGYLECGSPNARELQVKIGLRHTGDPMDSSPPLFDGIHQYRFDRSWRDGGQVVMQTDKPLPATIRAITPVFDTEP